MESAEFKTFKQHYADLKIGIDPDAIAARAYAKDLLTTAEKDGATHMMYTPAQRTEVILQAVEKRLSANASDFSVFLEVLGEDSALQHLVDKLESTLDKSPPLPVLLYYGRKLTTCGPCARWH